MTEIIHVSDLIRDVDKLTDSLEQRVPGIHDPFSFLYRWAGLCNGTHNCLHSFRGCNESDHILPGLTNGNRTFNLGGVFGHDRSHGKLDVRSDEQGVPWLSAIEDVAFKNYSCVRFRTRPGIYD